jgi:hypothetical protein
VLLVSGNPGLAARFLFFLPSEGWNWIGTWISDQGIGIVMKGGEGYVTHGMGFSGRIHGEVPKSVNRLIFYKRISGCVERKDEIFISTE